MGSMVGAVFLFVWGSVDGTLLPVSRQVIKPLPEEARVVAAMQASHVALGVDRIPGPAADANDKDPGVTEAYEQSFEQGPLAMTQRRSDAR